jgi:hypothetical protein
MVHPILSTKAAAATNTGNNISIFKNFISQYQSSNGAAARTVVQRHKKTMTSPLPLIIPEGQEQQVLQATELRVSLLQALK